MELADIIAKRMQEILAPRDKAIEELTGKVAALTEELAAAKSALTDAELRMESLATKDFAQQAIDSIPTAEDVAAVIVEGNHIVATVDAVATKWLHDNPPAPGRDGKDGENGKDGRDGIDGKPGEKGADGIGLAGAFINRDGDLTITLTNGEVKCLGPVVGKDGGNGQDGKDGADGVGFDDLQVEQDGEGGVTLKFLRGGIAKEFPLHFAIPTYRGYYREGRKVKAGNVVTHKGHAWIANRDAESTPCLENKEDWSLMVKAGRDGRDGYDGKNFGERPTVKLGGAGEPGNAS